MGHRNGCRTGRWASPSALSLAVAAVLATGLLCGCRTTRAPGARAPVPGDTEKAVWEALLREVYVGEKTQVVVLDPGLAYGEQDYWATTLQGVSADDWRAFKAAYQRSGRLPRDLDVGRPIQWFSSREWWTLPDGGGLEGRWSAFHERFPGNSGHISLSRVSISRDGSRAFVYGSVGSGSLSASGDFFILRKTATGWRVEKTHNFVMA